MGGQNFLHLGVKFQSTKVGSLPLSQGDGDYPLPLCFTLKTLSMQVFLRFWALGAFALFLAACQNAAGPAAAAEADAAGLVLPAGFQARVFADSLGHGRHMATRANGDLYLRLGTPEGGLSLVALRDSNGDGQADQRLYFGEYPGGTGIAIQEDYLYFSTNEAVYRQKLEDEDLLPSGPVERILLLPSQAQHAAKPLAFDGQGNMYVTIGAPSNACQDPDRSAGTPGQDPCPLLDSSGGIWRFSASVAEQRLADGQRYATGIRHAVGISWNEELDRLYAMQHGRDQLHEFWPALYSEKESAEMPAEEFLAIEEGDDFGWPYCYYDWKRKQKILGPEYGGNADSIGRCGEAKRPLMGFPGHWAPNALLFYQGQNFPVSYRGGAFIAFHGSWNRAPFPQQGYRVVFVPFSGQEPLSGYNSFATGFAGEGDQPQSPGSADYRPCGLALSPEGFLYVVDSKQGRIWQIFYSEG